MSHLSESKPIRVGVIGAGWVSTMRHIPAFKRDKRAVILAVLDHNLDRAESTARKFNIPRSFQRLEDFLQEPLDVVTVCTPPWDHMATVKAVLASHRHVLVEKPLTLTSEEGRELDMLASAKGVLLCPAHSFLFSRSVQQANSVLQKDKAGEIQWAMGIQLSSWRRRLPAWFDRLPGGLFFDEAPHLLYLMQHFLGDLAIEQAWNTLRQQDSHLKSERTEVRLRGTRGAGYLTVWNGAPFSEWLFVLFCSRGVLVLDLFRDIFIHLTPEKAHNPEDVLKLSLGATQQLWRGIGASGLRYMRKSLFFGHDLLVKRFLDAVVNGGEPPVTARQGWQVIALIEEILSRASRTT